MIYGIPPGGACGASVRPGAFFEKEKMTMANHIADGALFRDAPKNDGKVHPVMHIALTVAGVKLNLAVWPKTTEIGRAHV